MLGRNIVSRLGDDTYYLAAERKFEAQVEAYGGAALASDVIRFRNLLRRLGRSCKDTFIATETLHVPDQVEQWLRKAARAAL